MPLLKSNIDKFCGELFESNVLFTCNALEFGSSGAIGWFTNDNVIAMETLNETDLYPKMLPVNSSFSELVVKIENVFVSNAQFNFINFSLSGNLSDMLQFRLSNITCGTRVARSNSIRIEDFTIKGK